MLISKDLFWKSDTSCSWLITVKLIMIRRDNPSRAVALDLILRTFMNSSDFNKMQSKNWEAIAKLIPGTTPQEVCHSFEQFLITNLFHS